MTIQEYIKMAEGSPIQGYDSYERDDTPNADKKMDWLKTGKKILKELSKELRYYPDETFDIRINVAGTACSGDAILHSDNFYINLSQSCLGKDFGFMWRICDGKKDFTGKTNQWCKWNFLLDLPKLAAIMRKEYERK